MSRSKNSVTGSKGVKLPYGSALKYYKLDTPCAAGARSTSSIRGHPRSEIPNWRIPIRHSRIGYLTSILTPGTADHEHDTFLLNFYKKCPKTSPQKRPPMCSWYFLSSFRDDHFLDPWKSKPQSTGRQKHAGSPQHSFARINYFPDGGRRRRTDGGRTSGFHVPTDGKSASRKNWPISAHIWS